MKLRKQIEDRYKWNLEEYCKSKEDFYTRLKKCEQKKSEIAEYEGKLADEGVLLDYLLFDSKLGEELNQLGVYAYMLFSQDVRDITANEMQEEFERVATELSIADSFAIVEMSAFSDKKLESLMNNKKFADYKCSFYSILRHKKHVLSKKEEKLLSGMSFLGGFSDNFSKFSDGDLKFNKIKDSKGKFYNVDYSKYSQYLESKDRELRKNVYKEINGAFGRYINFITNNYLSDVKADCYFAKVRGYKSALSSSIYGEESSEKVYMALVDSVNDNVKILQNYMQIKKKLLGQKDIAIYDFSAPVIKKKSKKYSYDDSIELIKKAVAPLGEEYVSLIQRAKDEKWIDVMPNEGKYTGAYCIHAYEVTPRVLTNFTNDLSSVFTLAHELGHAMHSYYSSKNQPQPTSDYVIFVAEVASITNEMLLLKYLLNETKNKEEKIVLLDKLFNEVKSTIFRQTMFAEFEEKVYSMYEKGEALSKEKLCDLYLELNKKQFGKKVKMVDEVKYEWARIPHFYTSFYVYKYATGMISALNLAEKLFKGECGAREKYLDFLSAGSSDTPINILKKAGCDLEEMSTFENVFEELKNYLKEYQKLI